MECRTSFENVCHYFVQPFAIFFNCIALYVICKSSTKELSTYKTVLLITSIYDLWTACYGFLIGFHHETVNIVAIWQINGPIQWLINFLPEYQEIFLILYFATLTALTNLCAPAFVYRYIVVVKNYNASNKQIFLIYLIFVWPMIFWFPIHSYLVVKYSAFQLKLLPENYTPCLPTKLMTNYATSDLDNSFDKFLNIFAIFCSSGSQICFIIVVFCGIKIMLFLRQNKDIFQNSKIQSEINTTLAIQALLPVVLCGIPSFIGQGFQIVLGVQSPAYYYYTFMNRIWLILLNPLATIYFIKAYRQTVANFFRSPNYVRSIDNVS